MAKEKGRYLVPHLLERINDTNDLDKIIENENKLACIFASQVLFVLAFLNLFIRTVALKEALLEVIIDSLICVILGILFEVILRIKLKGNTLVNLVAALYAFWCIFFFVRYHYLLGPLMWIILLINLIVAMIQVKKNMLIMSGGVMILAGIYCFFYAPFENFQINQNFYGMIVLLFLITITIAGAVHRNNANRYHKLNKQLQLVMEQKEEIEELYKEVTAAENELHQQNKLLTAYNNIIKKNEERLHFLAYHDVLTELPNRKMINQRLEEMISEAKKQQSIVYVIYLDIDYFKNINDTMGHDAGDKFICVVADRIRAVIHPEDLFGRMGGDEFALIIPRNISEDEIYEYLLSIKDRFEESVNIHGKKIRSTASLGIATYPKDGEDAVMLMKNADIAMYRSKELGKNKIQFYHPDLQIEMIRKIKNNMG